jgi:uncharacterized membrane protein
MLPHRNLGKSMPNQWLGLVDALYAIAMTLLALEAPATFFEYFRLFIDHGNLFYLFRGSYSILTYLLVFFITYELWCYQRTVLNVLSSEFQRFQNVISGLLLAIICLIPAWASFLVKTHVQFYSGYRSLTGRPEAFVMLLAPPMVALAFWLISQLCPPRTSQLSTPETQIIRRAAIQRCIIFCLISLFYVANFLHPSKAEPYGNITLSAYLIYSFNQDRFHNLLANLPWKR